MDKAVINRSFLETKTFSELFSIADEFGIDVPDDFNRSFLIGEILEVLKENSDKDSLADIVFSDTEQTELASNYMPKSFNSTEVEMVLLNPAWIFVYWNISEADQFSLDSAFISNMILRVSAFNSKDQLKPDDFFDFKISKKDNGQYMLLPAGLHFFRADLIFDLDGIVDILASSSVYEIPKGSARLMDMRPGFSGKLDRLQKLSGMEDLLSDLYKNYRESFS